METTQRILLADIYGYCQRNKMLAKEHEENELANDSHTEEGVISETESIIHDVKEHVTALQPLPENEVMSGSPHLIQLETPPDITEELKVLKADYPGNSRFTVTAVIDEEQNCVQDSSSSEEELVNLGEALPLVDLSDSNCLPNLNSTGASSDQHDQASSVTLIDLDHSDGPLLNLNAPPLDPTCTSVQADMRITGMLLSE